HDEAAAKETRPNLIDNSAREKAVLTLLQRGLDELRTPAELRRRWRLFFLFGFFQNFLLRLFGLFIRFKGFRFSHDFAADEHERRALRVATLRLEADLAIIALTHEVTVVEGAVEKRFHPEVMILFPTRHQRMIVALRATDVHAKEPHAHVV